MTKKEALKQIKELEKYIESCDKNEEWVNIDYSVIPKETFEKYGGKPFQIMKCKMRKGDKVWNNITWFDAKKEAENLGYRLPSIQEMLVLLDAYKEKYPNNADIHHNEFLGIEELSYGESVSYEWIDAPVPVTRGGDWGDGTTAGAFTLYLLWVPSSAYYNVGFRCAR